LRFSMEINSSSKNEGAQPKADIPKRRHPQPSRDRPYDSDHD
jgi:hypothetical protein